MANNLKCNQFFNPTAPLEQRDGYIRRFICLSGDQFVFDFCEEVTIPRGGEMKWHFHPTKDEKIIVIEGFGTFMDSGKHVDLEPGSVFANLRGKAHKIIATGDNGIKYLVDATSDDESVPTIWQGDNSVYSFGIYDASSITGQMLSIPLANRVERWQKASGPTEPETYLSRMRVKGDVKIIIFYDSSGRIIASAFVGKTEGYDLEKTQAMLDFAKANIRLTNDAVWINYQSWETINGPTAFSPQHLADIWEVFRMAAKLAFPEAGQVVVRSRFKEVWEYVYTQPLWEVLCEVDLSKGFSWPAPDGKIFKDYDGKFAHYGILRMLL